MKYFSPQSTRHQGLKPPALYEYFMDNFWFKAAGLENQVINEPLRGSHKADNIYYGVGYNEGVPSTQTGGRIIADLMAGEINEFTSHFIVNKKIPYAGPKVLRSFFGALKKMYLVNVVKNTGHF